MTMNMLNTAAQAQNLWDFTVYHAPLYSKINRKDQSCQEFLQAICYRFYVFALTRFRWDLCEISINIS